ncbi:MAG TPA: hypothetical protein VEY12_12335 [Thermoplasmata archaeon]|nr:hypothetical protein [Thermoplasmata archaeon]
MRRILSVGIVLFVAVAFTLAVLSEGKGWLFLGSMVAAASMMIVVVFLLAFSTGHEPRPYGRSDTFLGFEEAGRQAIRSGFLDASVRSDPLGMTREHPEDERSRISARAFVRTLVPSPEVPRALTAASARREFLAALKREGTGLVRLAKVTGVDVAPYQAFLADARKAALRGDAGATLRSLQLANELLRASIEKFLVKRRATGQGIDEFTNF